MRIVLARQPSRVFPSPTPPSTCNSQTPSARNNGSAGGLIKRFGNRRLHEAQTSSPKLTQPNQTGLPAVANPSLQPLTNRITEDQDGDGQKEYTYDAAGNLTCDAAHCAAAPAPTPSYSYNAENKIVRVGGGAQAGGADYVYDGGGQRVKKIVGSVTTIFVYAAAFSSPSVSFFKGSEQRAVRFRFNQVFMTYEELWYQQGETATRDYQVI